MAKHFIKIVPLKNAGTENIPLQLTDCLKKKNIQVSKWVLMVQPHSLGKGQVFRLE